MYQLQQKKNDPRFFLSFFFVTFYVLYSAEIRSQPTIKVVKVWMDGWKQEETSDCATLTRPCNWIGVLSGYCCCCCEAKGPLDIKQPHDTSRSCYCLLFFFSSSSFLLCCPKRRLVSLLVKLSTGLLDSNRSVSGPEENDASFHISIPPKWPPK